MNEILPILYGVVVGFVCSFIGSNRARYICLGVLSALFGVVATFVTGEWKIGWEFLLIDIPLVAVCALAAVYVTRKLGIRLRRS